MSTEKKHKRILMVVTSHDRIDADRATGLWFEEFALPYVEFKAGGLAVAVASPRGGAAPIDPRSEPKSEAASAWAEARQALQQTKPLASVKADDFDAIFLPGGHGTMFDLPGNDALHRLLQAFADADKVVAAVCHGPAGLVGAKRSDGTPLVAGKTITAFTDDEERAAGLDGAMPFLLETKLRGMGARFVVRPNWSSHVEQDGRLITGQNPQSSGDTARAIIEALKK